MPAEPSVTFWQAGAYDAQDERTLAADHREDPYLKPAEEK